LNDSSKNTDHIVARF